VGRAHTQGERAELVSSVADKALATFVIIQSMLQRSAKLREYGKNAKLCERIPGYRVQMGFGLHVGWAIQGAIGSEYKVDASYLSPNINLASRLEVRPHITRPAVCFARVQRCVIKSTGFEPLCSFAYRSLVLSHLSPPQPG
jgi:class 3 adenylate cyclase